MPNMFDEVIKDTPETSETLDASQANFEVTLEEVGLDDTNEETPVDHQLNEFATQIGKQVGKQITDLTNVFTKALEEMNAKINNQSSYISSLAELIGQPIKPVKDSVAEKISIQPTAYKEKAKLPYLENKTKQAQVPYEPKFINNQGSLPMSKLPTFDINKTIDIVKEAGSNTPECGKIKPKPNGALSSMFNSSNNYILTSFRVSYLDNGRDRFDDVTIESSDVKNLYALFPGENKFLHFINGTVVVADINSGAPEISKDGIVIAKLINDTWKNTKLER